MIPLALTLNSYYPTLSHTHACITRTHAHIVNKIAHRYLLSFYSQNSEKAYTGEQSGAFGTVLQLDCRGLEPVEFQPRVHIFVVVCFFVFLLLWFGISSSSYCSFIFFIFFFVNIDIIIIAAASSRLSFSLGYINMLFFLLLW